MASNRKFISVIMPVHNGGRYLAEAIDSVLNQSYTSFELIVVDDGSTDDTSEVLASYRDSRLVVVRREKLGLVNALNEGLKLTRGDYIARMDADDICERTRLEVQADFLDQHPNIHVICTDITTIDMSGRAVGKETYRGLTSRALGNALLFRGKVKPVIHPSVMMRREVYQRVGGYRNFVGAEDSDYWLRCVDHFEFARLDTPLLRYRINLDGISFKRTSQQVLSAMLCAVNHRVTATTGVDIFETRADLWTLAESLLSAEDLLPPTIRSIDHFRDFKWALRRGSLRGTFRALFDGVSDSGILLIPYVHMRRLTNAVDAVTAIIEDRVANA
ncbi:glycosyltransferase [Cupriavidus sp. CV2]|uniref:glycosyltransferase n=1 Tax=Cupriavidus ulmosensis TaxID=3065913 RepID=UPI00296AFE60|nr:glycosyltransferase [Cupriavidus sp. CV2]MDW3681300.1 glycosyltransferase [Cupriavidus sp. CV2]